MKRYLLLIFLMLLAILSHAQCLDYEYLVGLFGKDLESQYAYLEEKSYKMEEGIKTENLIEWHNLSTGHYIDISYYPSSSEVKVVRYQMIEDKNCYESLKNGLEKLGYEKDTERVENSGLKFYYVSSDRGVVLNKVPGDGFVNHVFEVYDLDAYYLLFK